MAWGSTGKAAGIDPVTGKLFTKDIKDGHGKKPPAPKSQRDIQDEKRKKK